MGSASVSAYSARGSRLASRPRRSSRSPCRSATGRRGARRGSPSRRHIELAPEAASSPLRQNLVLEREEKRLVLKLQPFVIEQTSDAQDGLAREWERPDTGVERHRSYALQWYSFAVLAAILYVVLGFKQAGRARG